MKENKQNEMKKGQEKKKKHDSGIEHPTSFLVSNAVV